MAAKVSVIIPTFSRTVWLSQAIESVLNQTHVGVEVIVVNDGSATDTARVIASRYPGVHYVDQHHLGLGAARNTGFRESAGDYVAFLDDDDWLTPDSVAAKLGPLLADSQVGFVYSDLFLATADGNRLGCYYAARRRPMPAGDIYPALVRRNFIPVHAVLWRRTLLETLGGFPDKQGAVEDWHLLVRAAERTHAQYVDQPLGYYRLHGGNMTLQYSNQTREAGLTQIYIAHSTRFHQLAAHVRVRALSGFAWEQWLYGDQAMSRGLLRLAWMTRPGDAAVLLVGALMGLGRPLGRRLMRLYRRTRVMNRQQVSASDYFLRQI